MAEPSSRSVRVPEAAAARFQAAEGRLYPAAVLDPETYERALSLCGLVLTELRSHCADVDAVLDRRTTLVAALPTRAAAAGLSLDGFAAETVVDAASAVRCRELVQAANAADLRNRLAEARSAGREWLVEQPDPTSVMAGVQRRVEVHVPTGTVLVASVEAGGPALATTYRVEVVQSTGQVETERTFTDRDEWGRAVAQCRAAISARP